MSLGAESVTLCFPVNGEKEHLEEVLSKKQGIYPVLGLPDSTLSLYKSPLSRVAEEAPRNLSWGLLCADLSLGSSLLGGCIWGCSLPSSVHRDVGLLTSAPLCLSRSSHRAVLVPLSTEALMILQQHCQERESEAQW
jgi:hypothetical protein